MGCILLDVVTHLSRRSAYSLDCISIFYQCTEYTVSWHQRHFSVIKPASGNSSTMQHQGCPSFLFIPRRSFQDPLTHSLLCFPPFPALPTLPLSSSDFWMRFLLLLGGYTVIAFWDIKQKWSSCLFCFSNKNGQKLLDLPLFYKALSIPLASFVTFLPDLFAFGVNWSRIPKAWAPLSSSSGIPLSPRTRLLAVEKLLLRLFPP